MQVRKKDGTIEPWDHTKINKSVARMSEGLNVSASEIILNARIPEKAKKTLPTSEIKELIEMAAASEAWRNIDSSYLAARQRLELIYEDVFGSNVCRATLNADYRGAFVKGLKRAVKQGLFTGEVLEKFDLDALANALKPERDELYLWHSLRKLEFSYLGRDRSKKLFETPQAYHMRIAMGVSLNDVDPTASAIEAYEVYSTLRAAGSSPTLFNACSTYPQLSSCYLQEISDSTDGIMDGLKQAARKSKHAGGLGFHVSKIRAVGSAIKSINSSSSGIIPFLKLYNQSLIAFNQAGKRPGAGCAYMEPWHLDIFDFMELRRKDGDDSRRAHQINTAIWYPDLFFKRLEERQEWTLFCPSEVMDLTELYGDAFDERYAEYERLADAGKIKNFKRVAAVELWKTHIENLFETGHPWVTFKDTANLRYPNSHAGVIHGSNLCTEIFLATKPSEYDREFGNKTKVGETAVCNLSSVNLDRHTLKQEDGSYAIDWEVLASTVKTVIRRLDNVIDINFYPTEEAKNANMLHRPIGLGVMGWFEMYLKLGVPQDSPESVVLTSKVMEFISYHAILASHALSVEKGSYQTFEGSHWSQGIVPLDTYNSTIKRHTNPALVDAPVYMDWDKVRELVKGGMRNSCLMAIAPNASISYLLGCTASVEAPFGIVSSYDTGNGIYTIANPTISETLQPYWNYEIAQRIMTDRGSVQGIDEVPDSVKRLLRTAYEVDLNQSIMVNAARQKWADQGISYNVYFSTKSPKVISEAYKLAHRSGFKSTYYFYGQSASKSRSLSETRTEDPDAAAAAEAAKQACSLENPGACAMCEG